MIKRRVDLHLHSVYSDGGDTPSQIVEKAKDKGLWTIALTDHDNIEGSKEIVKLNDEKKQVFVSIPSLRDRIALSVQNKTDVDYLDKLQGFCDKMSYSEASRQMALEELSNSVTIGSNTERALESVYKRSKV